MKKLAFLLVCLSASLASAQIVRKDGTLQDALGRAMSQAQVYVCTQPCTSTSVPPSPLATIYSDSAGDASLFPGYVVTDGLGNYNYYFASSGAPYTEVFVWHGTIVKVLPDQDTFGSGGGSGFSFTCGGALNGSMVATKTTASASCDPLIGTDFNGNGFSQSWATLGAFNGFYQLKGGAADPGTSATYLMLSNAMRFLAPQTTTAPYSARVPSTPCQLNQVWGVTNVATDGNGQEVDSYGCLNNGSVSATATSPIVVTPSPGTGAFVISCPTCGTGGAPQASSPSAPTLTTNGTPGSTSYTYAVVGCEDGTACAYHSNGLQTTTIGTGNATLSGTNSINIKAYADTLYGYRCYNIYRTAGGATQGKIATCVSKQFIDTGLTGDATTAPATNTTVLDSNGLTNPLPGCNKIPAAPYGVDGPPCTPDATDDEFNWGNGTNVPADANDPQWSWVNQNSASLTLTNGMVTITSPSRSNLDNLNCIVQPVPASTPWAYVAVIYINPIPNGSNAPLIKGGLSLYEQSSGKLETWGTELSSNTANNAHFIFGQWTNTTTNSSFPTVSEPGAVPAGYEYWKIKNDGTNLTFLASPDGVNYLQARSELKASFFASGPSHIGICIDNVGGVSAYDIDYFRRVQ